MRAGTAVPGTSNQEEEAGASVAENETQVAGLDVPRKAFYSERAKLLRVSPWNVASTTNRLSNELSTRKGVSARRFCFACVLREIASRNRVSGVLQGEKIAYLTCYTGAQFLW